MKRALPLAALALAACTPPLPEHRVQLYALHTLVEVTVLEPDPARARDQLAAVEAALRTAERRYAAWGNGELARANAALAARGEAAVSAELAAALRDARALGERSGWSFDPGIGRMVELWGFHRDQPSPTRPPDPAALAALVARAPSLSDLTIDGGALATANPALWIDLGAYAKGAAVDATLAALRAHGARDALVAAAGDLCALGRRGLRAWRVGIRDPAAGGVLGSLALGDGECVSTSGDYERAFEWQGARYHHLLVPRSGRPTVGLRSVTVVATRGALADAAATAGMVLGTADAVALRALGVVAVLAVRADGTLEVSRAMRSQLTLGDRTRALREVP